MGSAAPPGKMDEKLKSENMQKKFSEWWVGVMKFSSPQAAMGTNPPNQNPADARADYMTRQPSKVIIIIIIILFAQ